MIYLLSLVIISLLVTFGFSTILMPRLKRFGITGNDVNKPDRPEVAEMGGISIVAGFTAGVLLAVFAYSFLGFTGINILHVLAALITVHTIAFIGMVDDILDVPQWLKAILPLFAGIPLIAIRAAGSTMIALPFFGMVDLGVLYLVLLVPLGVAVASNLTNMFAGFNGMEAGLGVIIFIFASLFALANGNVVVLVIFLPMIGALLGFLPNNWYPAKVFPGDVGNLTIGGVLAAGVIIGNMEAIGALFLTLYVIDFFIKAANRFPSSKWWGEWKGGKLYPLEGKVRGLCQLVMKLSKGIHERDLVLLLMAIQIIICALTILFFLKF